MKESSRWHSPRLGQEVTVVRWGTYGAPVLLFPTAGGDAEEVERFQLVDACSALLEQGRAKIYSCDSVAGRSWVEGKGSDRHRAWVQNQFHAFILHEVVPAIRMDCRSPQIEVTAAGASIGAYNALAVLCRFPSVFNRAVCMSGTYDLSRFLQSQGTSDDFYHVSPLLFLPDLAGDQLERLRTRFALLASGEGRAEDLSESWRVANLLGRKGIPNRVDPWGPDWHHDWPTWRAMLPRYLDELLPKP